jgi:5S rRNA maturation endonuclease (ribonuclease M5)
VSARGHDPCEAVYAALDAAGCSPTGPPHKTAARCPAHDDRHPSLSVARGDDGRALVHCHADCGIEEITDALGLTLADLYGEGTAGNGRREIVATYDYTDERGELLFQVVRYAPKDFRQRRPDGSGGWAWTLGDTRRVLYRLPAVIAAVAAGEPVYIVEGEKDVHAAERAGVVATTNPSGAGKWRAEYGEPLSAARILVVADRDKRGRQHARAVAEALRGIAAHVQIAEPIEGNDLSDHLRAGKPLAELAAAEHRADTQRRERKTARAATRNARVGPQPLRLHNPGPGPSPGPGVTSEGDRPEIYELLEEYEAGELTPAPLSLPVERLPARAKAARRVAADIELQMGLRLKVDEDRPLPYGTQWCAERCGLRDKRHASRVLLQLERAGVIRNVGSMPPRGLPDGTKMYLPGLAVAPAGVDAVEGEAVGVEPVSPFEPRHEVDKQGAVKRAALGQRLDGLAASGHAASRALHDPDDMADGGEHDAVRRAEGIAARHGGSGA